MASAGNAGKGPARHSGNHHGALMAALIAKRQRTEDGYKSRIAAAHDTFNEAENVLTQVFDMPESNSLKARVAESIAKRVERIVSDVFADLGNDTRNEVRSRPQLLASFLCCRSIDKAWDMFPNPVYNYTCTTTVVRSVYMYYVHIITLTTHSQ